jgi:hypothetical protein
VILQGDRKKIARCPMIVAQTFHKVNEILAANNIDFNRDPHKHEVGQAAINTRINSWLM